MLDLIDLSQAGILCGLLSIYVLLLKKNALRSYSDYLLATFIFFQCWTAGAYVLIITGVVLEVPFFYKTAAPINFLIPPLGYLYVRSVLFNERKWTSLDLLHLLPFALFLVSYLPFFLSTSAFKLEVVTEFLQDQNSAVTRSLGLIPEPIFHFSRAGQAIFYLAAQWWLIFTFHKRTKDQAIESQILHVVRWLKIFTGANTLNWMGFLLVIVLYLLGLNIFEESLLNLLPTVLLGFSFFLIGAYLLIHPQVLIGLPFVRPADSNLEMVDHEDTRTPFCVENYAQEIAILDHYFVSSKAFLQPNLTISEVAVATGLPVRELSYLINSYYKKRFSDYLNEMRIAHFLTQVDASSLDNFTIESIALSAGFSSRSSFYRAFNRFYGCTPSEYLRGNVAKE
ncbi:MAG: helix-turn-helix domain-containing protein [Algoriphagus sp.]|nr:helix-turn-helix domain-containing protein [Algoriphagus sp.]